MTTMVLPKAVVEEVKRQAQMRAGNDMEVLLPEDRDSFLANLPQDHQHQVEGEQIWNETVERVSAQNEAVERQRRVGGGNVVPGVADQRQFMTVREVSRRWAMHERSVWRMISDGRLNAYKISNSRRLLVADVEKCERNDGQSAA